MDTSPVPGLALVTGGSTGIGKEVARCLADDGYALVVAADEPEIREAARELAARGASVVPVEVDLVTPDGVEELHRVVLAQPELLEVVVLNAGRGVSGRQDRTPLDDDLAVVDLNVRSVVHLTKLVVPGLVQRARGRLMFLSSIAAEAPGPYHATYSASKAFVHSYAESLRHEVRASGATVTSVKPGPTDTAFFDRSEMHDTRIAQGRKDSAADVAREAYDAPRAGTHEVVTGSSRNLLQAAVARVVPDRITAAVAARQLKPGQPTPASDTENDQTEHDPTEKEN